MTTEAENNDTVPGLSDPAAAVPATPAGPASPGTMIREARQAQHLSVDDLAGQTKLARTTVEALERDDFGALLEPVYVRGYYRKCAKILGIDEKRLIDAYSSRVTQRSPLPPAKLRLASGSDLGSDRRLPMTMGLLFVVIAVLVCGALWWLRGATTTLVPHSMPAPVAVAPTPESPAGATAAGPAPESSPMAPTAPTASTDNNAMPPVPAPQDGAAPVAAGPDAAPPPEPTATTPAATPPAATKPAVTTGSAESAVGPLKLRFARSSWVRIKDAAGRSLLAGTMQAGETHQLAGTPPFDLLLGNAPAVTVEYDGKPVDINPYLRDSGTAHFQLPAAPATTP
jgi:cytoskeleton protein RodZ